MHKGSMLYSSASNIAVEQVGAMLVRLCIENTGVAKLNCQNSQRDEAYASANFHPSE